MPAIKINLLEHKKLDSTPLGSILMWALTYGRYIIVCTEIIVLLAFIWRFSLDRKITDLSEEINQKVAIIEANLPFENQFRNLQKRIDQIGVLTENQNLSITILKHLEKITPAGIQYRSYNFENQKISISALASTTISLNVFLKNLKTSTYLTNINVVSLSKNNTGKGETTFEIEAQIKDSIPKEQKITQKL
jgi:Tfp pilus assembly protein PilN